MAYTSAIDADELIDIHEVSRLCGLKVPTIYGLVHEGGIPSVKIGSHARLFHRVAIVAWAQQRASRITNTLQSKRAE